MKYKKWFKFSETTKGFKYIFGTKENPEYEIYAYKPIVKGLSNILFMLKLRNLENLNELNMGSYTTKAKARHYAKIYMRLNPNGTGFIGVVENE